MKKRSTDDGPERPHEGTMTEVAFAMRLGRPVVILEPGLEVDGVDRAATPEEAVELALSRARAGA